VSIGKNVPNLISYLHEFFQNFSQSLAICFELFFLSGKLFIQKSLTSGPHLSDAARRDGPARQRTVATWPPHAAPTPRLKAAVGTARRASRQPPRPRRSPPDSHLARVARLATAPRLAHAAAAPTASRAPPSSRPPPRRPRRCPDRFVDRAAVPTKASPVDVAPSSAVPAPVSHRSSAASRAPAPCRRRLAEQRHRTLHRRAPRAHARAVRLGRARFRPSGTRLNFIIF
jgi:hypothetical protein